MPLSIGAANGNSQCSAQCLANSPAHRRANDYAVIDAFGESRCMFESNFPVDKPSCSYRTLWNTFKRIAAARRMSAAQKRAIFHDTAARVYGLPLIDTAGPQPKASL